MIVMAIVFAVILKKPTSDEDEVGKEIVSTRTPEELAEETVKRDKWTRAKPPPPRLQLANARERRLREIRIQTTIKELIFYLSFLGIAFFTIYSMHDDRTYQQTDMYTKRFVQGSWNLDARKGVAKLESVR